MKKENEPGCFPCGFEPGNIQFSQGEIQFLQWNLNIQVYKTRFPGF